MSEYFVAPRAEADMAQIWLYIAGDRPGAGDRTIDRLISHFSLLASNPQLGEACPQFSPDLRRSLVGIYVVLYRPRPQRVEIVRVIHVARDVGEEFRRHWFS